MINKPKTYKYRLATLSLFLTYVLSLFVSCVFASAKVNSTNKSVVFDQSPVLISDTLKRTDRKQVVSSSLNPLTENIYCSALKSYAFLKQRFPELTLSSGDPLDIDEVSAINAFYQGEDERSFQLLSRVFYETKDSIQKAKTCLNLIKICYLEHRFLDAMDFVRAAKGSLNGYYSPKQTYEYLFMTAKISLCQGLTSKAEHIVIAQVLPRSTRFKGQRNEYNCYLFLGKVYLKAQQMTQAKWFFVQANSIAKQQNYIDGQIETSLLLATTKIKIGDRSVALQDLAKAKRLINGEYQIYSADLKMLKQLAQH